MTRKFVKFVFYRAEDIPYSPPSVTHSIRQIVPHPLPHVMLSYDSYLISEFLRPLHTPPEWAIQQPVESREVVYYILSGTPRSPQKCFWSDLRVEFLGENHFLLICGKMPNQTMQLT